MSVFIFDKDSAKLYVQFFRPKSPLYQSSEGYGDQNVRNTKEFTVY